MALIINNNNYQKILLDQCFINLNGLYIATIVFKDKEERNKDKLRSANYLEFLNSVSEKYNVINLIEDKATKDLELSKIDKVIYIANNFEKITYKYPNELDTDRITLNQEFLNLAKEYKFNITWYNDPVLLVRKDIIFSEQYNKQDFSLEAFYDSLKNNIYTDETGKLLVQDDL